jgi:hypothetical protein
MGPHKWRFVVQLLTENHQVPRSESGISKSDGKKRINEIQEAAQAHTSLEAISTVAMIGLSPICEAWMVWHA